MARWQQGLRLGRSTRWRAQDQSLTPPVPPLTPSPLTPYFFGGVLGKRLFRFQWRVSPSLSSGTTSQTITGVSRITVVTPRTINGVANISATTVKTVTGKARIQVTTDQTVTGVARVTTTSVKTITGVARITATSPKTITGVARITATTTRTISGTARIQATSIQTISGRSRITATTLITTTGKSRITASTVRNITGLSRITVLQPRTITSVANITSASPILKPLKSLIMDLDMAYLGTTLNVSGDTLPLSVVGSAPVGAPPNNVGLVIQVSGGVVTIWVWDGVAWRSR